MRKIAKNFDDIPEPLQDKEGLRDIQPEKKLEYDFPEVRDKLKEIYQSKCAYCEQLANMEIEHYRPKGGVAKQDRQVGEANKGYFWLQIEWTNLLYACHDCNGAKGTRFPIRNKADRIKSPVLDCNRMPVNLDIRVLNEIEKPLILNPEITDPLVHIRAKKDGRLSPLNNSREAAATIDVCKLCRDPLVIKRQNIIDSLRWRIEGQIAQRYRSITPLTDEQFEVQLFAIFTDMGKRLDEKMEFTIIGFSLFSFFDDMILEDLEEAFRKQVKDVFTRYCESA